MSGRLSPPSIKALGQVITGDGKISPYRSGPQLVDFFNRFGCDDEYRQGFPSRWQFAEEKLAELNGSKAISAIVAAVLDPREYIATDFSPDEVVEQLNTYLSYDDLRVVRKGRGYGLVTERGTGVDLVAEATSSDPVSLEFIHDQLEKCDAKLLASDYDGAITNARALLEAVLREMERRLTGAEPDTHGDLVKQYKKVQRLLNLDPGGKDVTGALRQVLSGLASIVSGLAGLRNAMGDAHARKYKPGAHHARLVVNAAKTLADFLFETYEYQQQRGMEAS